MKTRNKSRRTVLYAVSVAALGMAAWFVAKGQGVSIEPRPEAEVEMTAVDNGTTYKVYKGSLYRVNKGSGKWEFAKQYYDPDYFVKNYVERDGKIFRRVAKDELLPVKRDFKEGFEGTARLGDLVNLQRGWTNCELQSPQAPSVTEYVKLRNRILKEGADFLDNRVEPSGAVVHGGKIALKTEATPRSRAMVTAKASLSTELMHFVKGDDVWTSAWFYVPAESGMPFTVLDLESTWISEHPGMRIVLEDGKHACFQLKAGGHAYYRQPKGREVVFPRAKWVHLKGRLRLSEKEDGVIELWQDGQKIIDARGQTLPLAHAIYNSLEIGISAYNEPGKTATLYVDDVAISNQPLGD